MDDHLFFAHGRHELTTIHEKVKEFLNEQLLLKLKESATILSPVAAGVPFLGFRIWPRMIRLDAYRARRFRAMVRRRTREWQQNEIDEEAWVRSLTSLCGWVEQADTRELAKSLFHRMQEDGILPN